MRPPVGLVAAVLLSAFCLISFMFGLFDGDLTHEVASSVGPWGVVWGAVLLSVTAVPRVLPYAECPGAAPNASWMSGTELRTMRTEVLARLQKTDCCTHLNDGLRSLAEVPVLAAALPG